MKPYLMGYLIGGPVKVLAVIALNWRDVCPLSNSIAIENTIINSIHPGCSHFDVFCNTNQGFFKNSLSFILSLNLCLLSDFKLGHARVGAAHENTKPLRIGFCFSNVACVLTVQTEGICELCMYACWWVCWA